MKKILMILSLLLTSLLLMGCNFTTAPNNELDAVNKVISDFSLRKTLGYQLIIEQTYEETIVNRYEEQKTFEIVGSEVVSYFTINERRLNDLSEEAQFSETLNKYIFKNELLLDDLTDEVIEEITTEAYMQFNLIVKSISKEYFVFYSIENGIFKGNLQDDKVKEALDLVVSEVSNVQIEIVFSNNIKQIKINYKQAKTSTQIKIVFY
ncbi:hypothetical protein [Acholeplasma hippikon]|uniref:Lipoprotein n=1 Tax=Acholeplasma hippikon TaxID=264636 RepID=A0A449BL40_9MOLU|nr:hypothetical protein [Acholeplasma hippikon]VEU83159.1 Uncharacterised protein [Acholeplasma hippikon]